MSMILPIEDLYPVHPQFLNHDIMHCTRAEEAGNYLYSGRALGLTSPNDIIQLHRDLMPDFPAICDHYDRVSLQHTNQIIWNLRFDELENYPHYDVSYFCFGIQQHKITRHENWFRVVDFINSKNHFIETARQLGMQVPFAMCFDNRSQLDENVLPKIPYPCYLKAAIPVASVAIYRCEDENALLQNLTGFGKATPFQIQEEIEASHYLNLQYQVVGSRLERLAATGQILDKFTYLGSTYPTPHSAWYSVEPMAKWMFCQGMQGIFTFDVAVVEDDCGTDYVAIECNPRFNDAAYPSLIAKRLGITRWQSRVFYTRYRQITELPIRDLEYNPAEQTGIVLVNWGTVRQGKLTVLLAGSPEQQAYLLDVLLQRL